MNAAMHIFMTLGFTVAERVLYVPSVGYCLVLGMILDRFIPNIKNDVNENDIAEKAKPNSVKASGSVVKDAKAAVSSHDTQRGQSETKIKVAQVLAVLLILAYASRSDSQPPIMCNSLPMAVS